MKNRLNIKPAFITLFVLGIAINSSVSAQGIPVSFSSIPKAGTVLIYSHQDDDVIWMLPWWNKTEKFVQAAMPSTPIFHTVIQNQQGYLDTHGYPIPYSTTWTNPWTDITDNEYFWYYWNANAAYNYLNLDHLITKLSSDTAKVSRPELNKMKAKLEQTIASPTVSRIITHDNWGEYGHMHHRAVNKAVRELAVKYRKDVWMLGTDGNFGDWPIPQGANIKYSLANYDATLYTAIRNIYINVSTVNNYWTWDQTYVPGNNIKYIQIVAAGVDKSNILTGEAVPVSGPVQDKPGSYIFNGISDYMTLTGNKYTSFTIGMWIRPDLIKSMDISKMTEYPAAPSDDRSFYMQSNGHVTARIFDGSSKTVTSNTALSAGNWTHVLMTGNGSTLKIYINGIYENSVPAGPASTSYTTPEFVLGQAQETPSFFQGQIYDVRLYDHVLTDTEISALGSTGTTTYTITASAGTGGTISPSGSVIVNQGSNQTFSITPTGGYQVADVIVDNNSEGPQTSYTFTNITADHTIAASFSTVSLTNLTISGVTASNKVYNGTTAATLNTGGATLVGVLGGDVVSLVSAGATGSFADKNVGTGKLVTTSGFTLTGADAGKYTLTQPLTTANISTATLTVTGVTADNKVYNGMTAATLNIGAAVLNGIRGGDAVSLNSTGAMGAFSNKNAGVAKTVTTFGFVLNGIDAPNYTLTQPSLTANITAAPLTINGVSANNKIYNSSTAATLNSGSAVLAGIISGDAVNLSTAGATGTFVNKNVGTNKSVTTSGFTISGTDSGNYTLVQPATTASITTASLNVTGITANNKVYNATTAATLNTGSASLVGVLGSDAVTLVSTGATGTFANKNAGTGKPVTASGFTLSGADAGNYILTQPSATADITTANLTASGVTANNKSYDGTTSATLNSGSATLAVVFGSDAVTLVSAGATGTFVNKNVGTNKSVTTSGFTLGGADAGNYTLTQPSATASITSVALTITGVAANNKVYNALTSATLNTGSATLSGIMGSDAVTLVSSGATGSFANKNVGTNKLVTTSGFTLSGADAGNYTVTQPTATASITSVSLNVTGVVANNRVYNATTSATLNTASSALVGVVAGDVVALSFAGAAGTFADKNVAPAIPVTITGITLSGTDAGNYTLVQPSSSANITAAGLSVTGVTASNKIYDATTSAVVNTGSAALTGVLGGDAVTLVSGGATGTFVNKNVGTNKSVTTSGFTISGTDSGNYTLTQPSTTASITSASLTITGVTANDKVYDRTTAATLNTGSASLAGVMPGDLVSLNTASATGTFVSKTVGTGKTVSTSGFSLTGTDAGNYLLTQPSAAADITTAGITVSGITANNKVYNGTTTATLNAAGAALSGVFGGDVVSPVTSGATGTFDSKNTGTGIAVTISGVTLSGADAANYSLTQPSSAANITAAGLTITGVTAANKVYDGSTAATLNTGSASLSGVFGGDAVGLVSNGATGTFINKNAGTNKSVTTSGFTISGTDSGNYTLTQPATTASITTASLNVTGITANNKVYNRTTAATLNTGSASLSGFITGDIVSPVVSGATGTFAVKNTGTGIAVAISGVTLSGADAGNYTLIQPSSFADITAAGLSITGVTAANKVYDGSTSATLNTGSASLAGVISGDAVGLISNGATGAFVNKNVGTGKTVSTSGFSAGGTDAGNYILTQPATTANITGVTLTITGVTANNKVYDRTTAAALNTGSATLSGIMGSDAVTLVSSGATGSFSNKNVGTNKLVTTSGFTLSGTDAGNYLLTQPSAAADITTAGITVSGITANNKVYNGTTTATLNAAGAALSGVFGGDVVSPVTSGATGTFDSKNTGTGIAVTISGVTLSGADAGNYSLTQPTSAANITAAGLTITGVTAANKVYDATTSAVVNTGSAALAGVLGGDAVTLVSGGATGTFVNKNVGTNKSVTTSGFTISGTDSGNYTLTQPATTASITTASLNVTGITANNKVYNRTTAATLNTGSASLSGFITGDIVSPVVSGATGTFAVKNTGTGIAVAISGVTLSGADAGNYTLIQPSSFADITAAGLSITGVTAANKVYDGSTSATLNTGSASLSGVFGGDAVSLVSSGATGTFSDKNAGTGKVVTTSGFALSGTDAGNYSITEPTLTANITGVTLTISGVTASNKVYDRTTAATLNTGSASLTGVMPGDLVSLNTASATGTFVSKTVGAGKTVSISGFSLTGTDAGNYILTQPSAIANITTAGITVSGITANNKVYNGTTAATLNAAGAALSGVFGGDVVSPVTSGATGTFDSKNTGTGIAVTISGVTLSGADAGNYSLTQPSSAADITAAGLTITGVTAASKVYDGATAATLNTGSASLSGVFGGDAVGLVTNGATGAFVNKNVGTGKTVITSGFSAGGTDAGNYVLTQPTTTANITGVALTITGVTANNKVYDRTTAATLNTGSASLAGVMPGDLVSLNTASATGTFVSKTVGTGKTVSTSGFSLTGTDAGNYLLTQPSAAADITTAGITVSGITANNKVYNGTTAATLNAAGAALSGVFGGDVVSPVTSGATGTFDSKNTGTGIAVTISGVTLSGADAANYTLTQPTSAANITAAGLTITGVTAANKVYDGSTAATLNTGSATLSGVIGSDVVSLVISGAAGNFNNKNAGTGKPVSTSGFALSGTDAGNYLLTQPSATADIITASITVSGITANNKVYNRTTAATLNTGSASLSGFITGDIVSPVVSGATGTFAGKNTGTGIAVAISGVTLSGADAGNYTLIQPSSFANITAAGLSITGVTAANKVYDGSTAATLNTGSASLAGVISGDAVSLVSSGATGTFSDKNAGTGKVVTTSGFALSGTDAGNYSITEPTLTANITGVTLTISGVTANNKIYDRSTTATLNTGGAVLSGTISGDAVNLITSGSAGTFSNKNIGTEKLVTTSGFTLGGTDAGNYILTQPSAAADITTAGITVSGITANNKVYNGTTAATLNAAGAALSGVFGGDVVSPVTSGATGTFDSKNTGTGIAVTISGVTLSGADAGNYSLTQPTSAANITAAGLTITGVTAANKVYDGSTAATLNTGSATLSGVIGSDVVSLVVSGAAGNFNNKNAGTGKPVSTSGFALSGTDSGNYTLTQPATTASITTASLNITGITANNKVYNRTTAATLNTGSASLSGFITGDIVSPVVSGATGTFAVKNTGTGIAVAISGVTLSGADAGNYTLIQPSSFADITAAGLSITGVTAANKVYDGSTAATLNTGSASLSGVFGGDAVSLVSSGATGTFSDKNAGTGKVVTTSGFALSGTDAGNYSITEPTLTANITGVTLTITGVTASNKVYDRTTAATLNTGSASLTGVMPGDLVSLNTASATGTFVSKTVGAGKTVSISGFSLTGTDAGNYLLTQPSATADITTAGITVSGITANNKVYNGTTAATLNAAGAALSGVFGGDVVSLVTSGATGTFDSKNTGTGIAVTISGVTLSGADAGNYSLTQPSSAADITAAGLTITGVTAASKVYDGATAATLNTGSASLSGVFGGDAVGLVTNGATGAFVNKNVGTGKTVSTSGFSAGGTDAGNYTLTQPVTTANITAASLTITGVTANNKVYDRTTAVSLNTAGITLTGVMEGDLVSPVTTGVSGVFVTRNAGTAITVTISGITLSGPDAGNYLFLQPSTAADILTAGLSVSGITANNKIYNGSVSATLNTSSASLAGVFSGDIVSLGTSGAIGTFTNRNAGSAVPVIISGLSISGADASNYVLTQPAASANITAASLTITGVTAVNKTYDATNTVTLNTGGAVLSGVIGSDLVTLVSASASGTFINKNIGIGKQVTTSGFSLTGDDAGNYSLVQPTTTANITSAVLTVSGITANNKIYDRTTSATLNSSGAVLAGIFGSDNVSLVTTGATGTFANKNVGAGKLITMSGYTLGGIDAPNYSLSQPVAQADITSAALTVTGVTANNRVYNGTTAATLNTGSAALSGIFAGDAVTLILSGVSANFSDKNAGSGKAVVTTGFSISGADATNYILSQPTLTASITAISLTITGVTANNKVYDRSTTATLNTGSAALTGIISGDAVNLITSGSAGTFSNKNIGTGKPVTTSGFTLGGTDAVNYSLTQPSVTANITSASLTISGVTVNNKIYNGTTSATLNTAGASLTGVFSGDAVNLVTSAASGVFSNKNVGTLKGVSISGFSINGSDALNYSLAQPSGTANITPATITITGASARNKVYDGTPSADLNLTGLGLSGVFGSDLLTLMFSGVTGTFATSNAGTSIPVAITGFTLSGPDALNYILNQPTSSANITPAGLTVSVISANNKVYDGTKTATLNSSGSFLAGIFGSDLVTLVSNTATASFASKNVGTGIAVTASGFTLSGAQASNYFLTQPSLTADITSATLHVTGISAISKVYDGNITASLNTAGSSLTGVYPGDLVTLLTSGVSGSFADKSIGTNKPVSISGLVITGADASNYTLAQPSAAASITSVSLTITGVTAGNKVYDGTTAAIVNSGSAILSGIVSGDNVSLISAGVTGTFSDKNAGTAKAVSVSGFTLGGTDAVNYLLTQPVTTANITVAPLTVTGITANNKSYDRTTTATLNTSGALLSGLFGNDNVTLVTSGATGSFVSRNAGSAIQVTITGLTLGGTGISNYSLVQPTSTADITPANLIVQGVTAANKVYDGTVAASVNTVPAILSGVISGDAVTLIKTGVTGSFSDKNAGSSKVVSLSGFTISGTDAGNYLLSQPSATAAISTASLIITGVTAYNKIYDRTTAATLNTDNALLGTLFGADIVNLVTTGAVGTFANKNVGSSKTISVTGFTLTGTDASNYALVQPAASASITQAALAVTGITAVNKVYNGTVGAILNTVNAALAGLYPGDAVTLITSGVTGIFSDRKVGSSVPVTISGLTLTGPDALNYSLTQPSSSADITIAGLTVSGVTANNKIYDGTTVAVLNTGSAALSGVVAGDFVNLVSNQASGTFANKNSGNSRPVTTTGFILEGTDSDNYTLIQPVATANISPAGLTISGVTANNKIYDRTTVAALNTSNAVLTGVFGGDDVSLIKTGAIGSFGTKIVGAGKQVSSSGFAITGADAPNYSLSQPLTSADITPASLSIAGVSADNKVYNATTSAILNTTGASLIGVFGGDVVSLVATAATGNFADKNAGTAKTVFISGFTLTGSDASNYTLTMPMTTASISVRSLTISGITANNKPYDGTTTAVLNSIAGTLNGIAGTDEVNLISLAATGSFINRNTGTGKPVSTSGFTLGGTDASNYSVIQPSLTADITKRELTIGGAFIANNKIYDGNASATIISNNLILNSKVGSDDIVLNPVAVFDDAMVGTGKRVTLSGSALSGAELQNYSLSLTGAPTTTAAIALSGITVSGISAVSKIYDATTTASLTIGNITLTGIIGSDKVGIDPVNASGSFTDKKAGSSKIVRINGLILTGQDAGKYTLIQPSSTADINSATLIITGVSASNKVYDRSTAATVNAAGAALVGILGSDVVNLSTAGVTGSFATKTAGTSKTVTTSGFSIAGADALNYTLIQPAAISDITPATLTIEGVTANNKIYDRTTSAVLNTTAAILTGVIPGDVVSLIKTGAAGIFSDKNAATSKIVTISGFSLGGADAGNYSLVQPSSNAAILPGSVTISGIIANNKVYDGTSAALLNSGNAGISGDIGTDDLHLNSLHAAGAFTTKNAGSAITVTTSGYTLEGTDSGNYLLTLPTLKADIAPASLTITGITANNKVYNRSDDAALITGNSALSGVIGNDVVTLLTSGAAGKFADKNAGKNKVVTTTGFNAGGIDAVNYSLIQPSTFADITTAPLNVSGITANNKTYDGINAATLNSSGGFLTGVVTGDLVNLISTVASGVFSDKNAGSGKQVTTSGFTAGGNDAGNYTVVQPVMSAEIFPKQATVIARDLVKTYGTILPFTGTEYTSPDLVQGDILHNVVLVSSGAAASAAAGTYNISITSGSDNNYHFTYVNGRLTVNKATLTATADNKSKYYGSANPVLSVSYSGLAGNEDISVIDVLPLVSTNALGSSDAGVYPITLTGGTDDNYNLALVNGSLNIMKAPLSVTAEDKSKIYGQANPVLTISYSGFVPGQDESIIDVLPVAGTTANLNSDAGFYDIIASGGADANYSFIYNKGVLKINKADQTISFDKIPSGLRMTQAHLLNAATVSGLPVRFESSDPDKGSINGNVLTVKEDGTFTITAMQEGDHNWNPAVSVNQSIVTLPAFDYIMSLFTPNNDGINDLWYIPSIEQYGTLQVSVYNRYGKTVFQSDSYKNDWDGTWNGNPLPSATYYYLIKSSNKGFIKGVVNIVR